MFNENMYKLGAKGSDIRELFEYGKKRKQVIGDDKVFDFSIGNPSVPSPSIVNDTLVDLIQTVEPTKLHGYTSASGDNFVKESIAKYINNKYNTNVNSNLIYMTCGAAASLSITFRAILNPGDEVIVFTPYFPEYKVFVENASGKIVPVESIIPSFIPDFDALEKSINKNTKAVIINSPNNPTGVVYSEEIIKKLSDILRFKEKEFNQNIYLVSDEPYRELVYGDVNVPYITNYYDNAIVCYSFSKSLSLPGERIGYILVNPKCNDAVSVYKAICGAGRSMGFVCAPALFQYMVPKCLGYTSNIKVYEENRELLYNELTKYGYEVVKPEGAFYIFMKSLDKDAYAFSELAKKYELLLVPSDSFGVKGYIRISYCVSKEQIINSLPAFKKLIEEYKK